MTTPQRAAQAQSAHVHYDPPAPAATQPVPYPPDPSPAFYPHPMHQYQPVPGPPSPSPYPLPPPPQPTQPQRNPSAWKDWLRRPSMGRRKLAAEGNLPYTDPRTNNFDPQAPHRLVGPRQEPPMGYARYVPQDSAATLIEPYGQPPPGSWDPMHYDPYYYPTLDYRPAGFDPRLLEEGEDDPDAYRAHGIPPRLARDPTTIKRRVELWHGNLVLDCPVPSHLLQMLPDRTSREFTHMRYTACTADPNQWSKESYTLRPTLFQPPRRTELMICLTMYNEDERLFAQTMHAVMQNIADLQDTEWGEQAWKKIVVVIVSDGRKKCSERTLAVLATLGLYQEGVPETEGVCGKPVTAHIFEYSTQFSIDARHNIHHTNITPVQVVFCLKENNQKKINSHRWFFNAFAQELQPEVTILLDVGTVPRSKAIYRLWKAFKTDPNVAGACGEIVASKGKFYHDLFNPLVGAQNFEYKMSNILDKPLESVFGYISVLPGAFSAYRFQALQNDMGGNGPLAEYFKGELLHGGTEESDIFTSNMYLAEDRILCWELVTKRNAAWKLSYVKRSQAVTDVPESVPELMSQKRRWNNGAVFAGLHSCFKFYYIYRSRHGFFRKLLLHIELLYQLVNLLFAWLGLGNYFACFWILSKAVSQKVHGMKISGIVLTVIYLIALIMTVILAIGNRPQGSRRSYTNLMIIFALITLYMIACGVVLAVLSIKQVVQAHDGNALQLMTNPVFRNIIVSAMATYGCWLIASILWLEPWHMITSSIQYVLMAPTWVNIFSSYAYSNIHDVSWGTKGDNMPTGPKPKPSNKDYPEKAQVDVNLPTDDNDLNDRYDDAWELLRQPPTKEKIKRNPASRAKDYYATVRSNVLLAWILSNAGLAIGICLISNVRVQVLYMGVLLYSAAGIAALKLLGTIIYLINFLIKRE